MRDRIITLIMKAKSPVISLATAEKLADHILEDGWIRPPCKVGDKVYVIFSTFYAEYTIKKIIYDGAFWWAKLFNKEYEPQDKEILRCIQFDINKTIFLSEDEAKAKIALVEGWGVRKE